jgi:UPF0042 nucleotide-binding protein
MKQINKSNLGIVAKSFEKKQRREILIVTGLSGSGKSTVMSSLEDIGFYCVDNFPVPLLSTFLDFIFASHTNLLKVALGIDIRGGEFLKNFISEVGKIKRRKDNDFLCKIVFLNARDSTLVKRFQETRRSHPLAKDISLMCAIKKERKILLPIETLSDQIHYTDRSNIHELRRWVSDTFSGEMIQEVVVNIVSFGFKYGVPADSNLVYDLRFLPNPYFIPELKKLDGRNRLVQDYLFKKEVVNVFWEKLVDFLKFQLKWYYNEGRFFANVSIGCTGGKHRSVSFVERIYDLNFSHVKFLKHHRDVEKG